MNKAMSLKAKIKNLAKINRVPAQAVLQNYMLERLLQRISESQYKEKFILKGGLLISSMVGISNRTTMDLDASLRGYPLTEGAIREMLEKICAINLNDGVEIQVEQVNPIREDDEYGGYRGTILAVYESINTPLKIDITAGDVLTPGAVRYFFRSIFEEKQIEIWAYNTETILAEKIETILRRSVLNTRPRDFYDVYLLLKSEGTHFNQTVLNKALIATVEQRNSTAAYQDRVIILGAIQMDSNMRQRWERYSDDHYYARGISFDDVIEVIRKTIT